jgi:hypothetical protein
MVEIREIIKGITIFIFTTLLFYFLWQNIFSNILDWAGTNFITGSPDASTNILKAFAWVSFIVLYLFSSPIFLVYSIITGSRDEVKTKPLEILKGISIWCVSMPLASVVYLIVDSIVTSGAGIGTMDAGALAMAITMSWLIAFIVIVVVDLVPFIFILKGYGFLKDEEGKSE